MSDVNEMDIDVHVVGPTQGDLLCERLEEQYEFSGNYLCFIGGEAHLDGKFTAAQLREIADALETP